MSRSIWATGVAAALLLAGCNDRKPVGGVSADDAAALNNAAEILDASPDGLAAPPGLQPANDAESATDTTANSATHDLIRWQRAGAIARAARRGPRSPRG